MLIYQELVLFFLFDRHRQKNESSPRMARWSMQSSALDSVPRPSLSEIIKSSEDYGISYARNFLTRANVYFYPRMR